MKNHQTDERDHERHEQAPQPGATSAQAIDLLKRAYPIQDVLDRYGIALTGASLHRMACCPFHEDTHPSMGVFLDTNRFFCFRCGAKGDVLDLIQHLEGIPFREAVARLNRQTPADTYGSDQQRPDRQPKPTQPRQQQHHHMGEMSAAQNTTPVGRRGDADQSGEDPQLNTTMLTVATAIYQERLLRSPHALAYLHARGIPLAVALHARLGYADVTTLRAFVGQDATVVAAARQMGLVDAAGQDRMRGRLVMPEFRVGRCIWMVGRLIPPTSGVASHAQPKYLGVALPKPLLGLGLVAQYLPTPHVQKATSVLHEKRQRDGHAQAYSRGVLVVEGPFDLLTALVWRLPLPCVALVGTFANVQQAAELVALANGGPIWLALDADTAGEAGATRLRAQLSQAGYSTAQIKSLHIPEQAKDFSEIIASPTARRWVAMTLAETVASGRKGGR